MRNEILKKLLLRVVLLAQGIPLLNANLTAGTYTLTGVKERPVNGLADIAVASIDSDGPVIYYNPTLAQRAGPEVTAFARAHEYGHIRLHHVERSMFVSNPYVHLLQSRAAEIEADKFATEYWVKRNPRVLDVVVAKDLTDMLNLGDATHLPTPTRAAMIQQWRVEFGSTDAPAEVHEKTCPVCTGSGKCIVKSICPKCSGTGMLICANCRGRGGAVDYYGFVHPCLICGGLGKLVCLTCDGGGKVLSKLTCPRCEGTGVIGSRGD